MFLFIVVITTGCMQATKKDPTVLESPDPPISLHNPVILEIVKSEKDGPIEDSLFAIVSRNRVGGFDINKWNNHYVIFGLIMESQILRKEIISKFPNSEVKIYDDMFYEFDKRKHCKGTTINKEWSNVLLTANLVMDTALQNEYLEYHKNQFSKWPEVAKGFCNAEFQRVLLFRNERQLMLVITIPDHKTLDELNPKTTENNPKMDEWNSIMKKYQEGIEGTKPGEVWVFLKPVIQN